MRRCRSRVEVMNSREASWESDEFIAAVAPCDAPLTSCRATRASDLALFQYTSGTTRERPEAVPHTHRAVVSVAPAALYGLGIRPGDRYFCPSSPAWGHGMWHGTISPLALGVMTGVLRGAIRRVRRCCNHWRTLRITNLAAASTHYRMMRGVADASKHRLRHRRSCRLPVNPWTAPPQISSKGVVRDARRAACTARPRPE